MSSTRIFLFESDRLSFECANDEPTVYVRSKAGITIALNLSEADRAKLRAALDEADAIADKGDTK